MPAYWIYKCNAKGHEYQRTYGDWAEVFASTEAQWWGTTKIVPELANARVGDMILAYQTDRNELVGTARVVAWKRQGPHKRLVLKPTRPIGVRVRGLKERSTRVAKIPALQPGPIRTLYPISTPDAKALLAAAGVHLAHSLPDSEADADRATQGAGFGTPAQNKLVERAAVNHVKRHFKNLGWAVRDVSFENRGYDLLCRRSREERHVEVKGARGEGQQFIITARELDAWIKDHRFILAFVGAALTAKPSLAFFPQASSQKEFVLRPLAYIAKRQPNSRARAGKRNVRRHSR